MLPRSRILLLLVSLAALIAIAVAVAGCGSTAGDGRVRVIATTTQLGDLTRAVGGDAIAVHQILGPNTDPHTYEPRPQDVEATAGARLVVLNGDDLDAWMDDVVAGAGGHPRMLDAGARRPVRLAGPRTGAEASRFDPHWWHDPRNTEAAVAAIRDALVAVVPEHAAAFRRNAAAELARLRALDARIGRCMRAVPAAQRRLVTDHDAFGYFARRYGITVIGTIIPSQTTQAQPSAGDLAHLVRTIRRERVRAVFPESSLNARLAQAVARETGATARLTLYGDTLGPRGSAGATYLGMELANADAMVQGFTGAPRRCSAS